MARIRVLPEWLTNKIAAGEVVERPASVVKELVENAIDAESRRIAIEIQGRGCRTIRVVDDGFGMEEDDVILALERHATSKIEKDEDLAAIRTLGFRGEALPSLAAVSKFELTSRTRDSTAGTQIFVSGGVVKKVNQCGCPPGTQVWVRDLFFNQPARRKFLKTEKTEFGHVVDTLTRLALSRPEIHFSLRLRDRQVHDWPAAVNLQQRLAQIFSRGFSQSWLPLSQQQGSVAIEGYLSPPELHRSSSRMLFLYVNGRAVRDQLLRIAILEAYRTLLPKGQFPLGVLLLELPAQEVDVNVHPTKAEVRFQDPRGLSKKVTRAVQTALSGMERQRWARPLAAKGWQRAVEIPAQQELKQVPLKKMAVAEPRPSSYETVDALSAEFPISKDLEEEKEEAVRGIFDDLEVIGQLHHAYILCEAKDGLILIDQHAAHERVFFEIFRQEAIGGELPSQILIVPETIEVTAEEAAWLEDSLPLFSRLGFELEPFGTNTFVIRAVPAVALRQEVQRLLLELVASGCEGARSLGAEALLEKLLQSMACRVAIKAGQKMGKDEIMALLKQLDGLDLSSTCPHGRPLWWKITLEELERMFDRA
ncbi:MAG: DNA mismatch repair endonuclease MutL [Deltaproteobacteria bacterium]|nr:MAG: DNA mismatch repair endonuclease MutL [Deltaproteobacteria bacterium]